MNQVEETIMNLAAKQVEKCANIDFVMNKETIEAITNLIEKYALSSKVYAYGVGIVVIGMGLLALAFGLMLSAFFNAASRNPDCVKEIRAMLFIGIASIDLALLVSIASVLALIFG